MHLLSKEWLEIAVDSLEMQATFGFQTISSHHHSSFQGHTSVNMALAGVVK